MTPKMAAITDVTNHSTLQNLSENVCWKISSIIQY